MKLEITNFGALAGISAEAANEQLASVAKINDFTAQQADVGRALVWLHNARHEEFWRAREDAHLEAMLNGVGIAALQPLFEVNAQAAGLINQLAELWGIEARCLVEPLREIAVDGATGEISVKPKSIETP